jgi:signal transduction histidine kinase
MRSIYFSNSLSDVYPLNNVYLRHIFFCCLFFLATAVHSQLPYFSTTINEAKGLSSNYIKCMEWDGANRLWIGTDKGISIYDGHQFTYLNSQNGLEGSYIVQLLYDSLQRDMLIITSNRKLYSSDGQSLVSHSLPAGYHVISIAISNQLYQVTAEIPGKGIAFFIVASEQELSSAKPVLVVPADIAQNIGFGFGKELLVNSVNVSDIQLNTSLKGIQVQKKTSNSLPVYKLNEFGDVTISNKLVRWKYKGAETSFEVAASDRWVVGTAMQVDDKPAIILRIPNSGSLLCLKASGESMYVPDSISRLPAITQLLRGPDNSLLIGTLGSGLLVCHPSKGRMLLPGKHVRRIARGSIGDWMVADDELFLYDHTSLPKPTGISINKATSITERDGLLHCTSLLEYNRFRLNKNGSIQLLKKLPLTAGISDFELLPNKHFQLSTYSIGTILYDSAVKPYDTLNVISGSLHDDIIERIIPLKDGLAFTSFSNGVLIKNNNGKSLLLNKGKGLISNAVYYITEESSKILWICTEDGVTRYSSNSYTQYRSKEGFVGKKCLYFFIDKSDRKFVISDACIMLLTDDKLHPLQSFPIKPDPDAIISTVSFNKKTQVLDIGSSMGLFELDISRVKPDRSLLRPLVYYISTSDTTINNKDRQIVLPAGSHAIKIVSGFEQVDFSGHARLYYNLSGYNEEWLPVPADFTISIPKLSAGVYDLRMYSVNADGYAGKPEIVLQINKLYPWYLNRPLRIIYALLAALLVWIGAQVWVRNRIRQRIQHLLMGQQMQQERNRISSELHDNVGSQLTNIIVQLDYVEGSLQQHNTDAALQKVVGLQHKARQAMNQLRESIWVLKEDAVKLPAFVGRVHRYALEVFDEDAHISFDLESKVKKDIELTPWQAVNLLRILQEGFQNIQKHSGASEVHLTILYEFEMLKIILKDNGKGFYQSEVVQHGQGLANMQRRAKEMDGLLRVQSGDNPGTRIIIEIPIPHSKTN